MKRPLFLLALAIALVSGLQGYGCRKQADAWVEPPVFASRAGELNVVLIAKPASVTLGGWSTTGWVYQACRRLSSAQQDCPPGSGAVQPYGGVRLQLQPGDVLRIRLVNQLPPTPADAEHLGDMPTMLAQNPTNLHTHGLIVEPRNKTALDPTYGDYVYVLGYPAQSPPGMLMPGLDATTAPIDYAIDIPGNHPSGIYWFHPHVHGLSLNQISAGLSGMITVGAPGDYVASLADSDDAQPRIRHLMLKDLQVLPEGRVYTQENPRFCAPTPAAGEPPRAGFCPGGPSTDADGKPVDYSRGRWFFTVSGQLDPRLQVDPNGELWRLVNASGSRSYVLQLRDGGKGAPLPFQVVSLDGVALDPGTTDTGGRLTPTPCLPPAQRGAVCADSLRMMPSTRAELWIPGAGPTSRASLVTMDFSTGLDGDHWPAVELAQVEWKAKISQRAPSTVQTLTSGLSAGRTVFAEATARLPSLGRLVSLASWPRSAAPALAAKSAATPAAACTPLAPGHRRRIFFGVPTSAPTAFGLGYEELDDQGLPVPGTFQDLAPFDGSTVSVCVPLAAGNHPVTELWELVNVSREDHNFHIHQTKFRLLAGADSSLDLGAMMDSVPVPHGSDNCDASIGTWRSGTCVAAPVLVAIPFSQLGDFVYHCHILEHEDGGMMAHIRVVPAP